MAQAVELRDVQRQLEVVKGRAYTLVADLGREQLWARPSPEAWSVGECLAHLNVVGRLYLVKRLEPAVEAARAEGRVGTGPFRYGLLGGLFVRLQEPSVRMRLRLKAPKPFLPPAQPSEDVAAEFVTLQDDLAALTERADGLDLVRVTITSPVSKRLRLSLLEALGATLAHERRHLRQAERVKGVMKGS